jgi:hypothetical protein
MIGRFRRETNQPHVEAIYSRYKQQSNGEVSEFQFVQVGKNFIHFCCQSTGSHIISLPATARDIVTSKVWSNIFYNEVHNRLLAERSTDAQVNFFCRPLTTASIQVEAHVLWTLYHRWPVSLDGLGLQLVEKIFRTALAVVCVWRSLVQVKVKVLIQ